MRTAAVTVLMPAYNAENWLRRAIDSILRQTWRDFELLVVDDGSTDETARILRTYTDARLRVVTHATNQGLIASLNHGLDLARGEFLARMDADDISHPRRLELQRNFLLAHPEVGVCGTWFRACHGLRRVTVRTPCSHEAISARLFFRSPFGHPTVMLRKASLQESGLRYDPLAIHAEDFDLWIRARTRTRFANLPRVLLDYRVHPDQVSARQLRAQSDTAAALRLRQLQQLLPQASSAQRELHLRVCDNHVFRTVEELNEARQWLDLLRDANEAVGMFEREAFGEALAHAWHYCCLRATVAPHWLIPLHWSRSYARPSAERWRERLRVVGRSLLLSKSAG